MLKYLLVRVPIDEIEQFPAIVEEMLSTGWSLAGSLCIATLSSGACLVQPMTKETTAPADWLAGLGD